MGSDTNDRRGDQRALAAESLRRAQSLRREPPPKPLRQRPAPPEEDETTIRLLPGEGSGEFQIPEPPPLPDASAPTASAPSASPLGMWAPREESPLGASAPREESPLIAMEMPRALGAAQFSAVVSALRGRYAKIGAGIFAAGVLVGVVASAALMGGSEPVADTAAPASAAARQAPAPTAAARAVEEPQK